ncbi:hypothetical protein F5887DRAFT_1071141 [Amanita rubescens]|nr:hypothetical protein F5887DRAFT_1071141 [Amanita rubescens]
MSFGHAPRKGVGRNTPPGPQQSHNNSLMASSRSSSVNIPGSFALPKDTANVTQRSASMSIPKLASETPGECVIDLNISPTNSRPRTPLGAKPGSSSRQAKPSYSSMVSASSKNSGATTPTVASTAADKMTEHAMPALTSKRDLCKGLGLGLKVPSPTELVMPIAVVLAQPPQTRDFASELEEKLSPIANRKDVHTSSALIEAEEEREVAESILVFRPNSGRGRNGSHASNEGHLTPGSRRDSPSPGVVDSEDVLDRLIMEQEKQMSTLASQLGSVMSKQMTRMAEQLNTVMAQQVSRIESTMRNQGESYVTLIQFLKNSRRRSSSRRNSSRTPEHQRRSKRAQGKQRSTETVGPQDIEGTGGGAVEDKAPAYIRDDRQLDVDLLRLISPTDLDTLLVLRRNETIRCTLSGEEKFATLRKDPGETSHTYHARLDWGAPASVLFEQMNPYKRETCFEDKDDGHATQQHRDSSTHYEMPTCLSRQGGCHSGGSSPTPTKPNWLTSNFGREVITGDFRSPVDRATEKTDNLVCQVIQDAVAASAAVSGDLSSLGKVPFKLVPPEFKGMVCPPSILLQSAFCLLPSAFDPLRSDAREFIGVRRMRGNMSDYVGPQAHDASSRDAARKFEQLEQKSRTVPELRRDLKQLGMQMVEALTDYAMSRCFMDALKPEIASAVVARGSNPENSHFHLLAQKAIDEEEAISYKHRMDKYKMKSVPVLSKLSKSYGTKSGYNSTKETTRTTGTSKSSISLTRKSIDSVSISSLLGLKKTGTGPDQDRFGPDCSLRS